MRHNLTFILLCVGLFGLTACSKKENKPGIEVADITAEIIMASGKKVDFSDSMDKFDFLHGPDEDGNVYVIQFYPRTIVDGITYSSMIDARMNGSGKAG